MSAILSKRRRTCCIPYSNRTLTIYSLVVYALNAYRAQRSRSSTTDPVGELRITQSRLERHLVSTVHVSVHSNAITIISRQGEGLIFSRGKWVFDPSVDSLQYFDTSISAITTALKRSGAIVRKRDISVFDSFFFAFFAGLNA